LYKQVLFIDQQTVGEEHLNYAITLGNIASLYSELGQREKALITLEKAIRIREGAVGRVHPRVGNAYANLAIMYEEDGREKEAEDTYLLALDILEKTSGKEDDTYTTVLGNLAELYADYGHYKKAEAMYFEVLAILEKIVGKEHPSYAGGLRSLGTMYRDKETEEGYEIAEKYLTEALGIMVNSYGGKNRYLSGCYNAMAMLCLKRGEYEGVLNLARESIYSNSLSLQEKKMEDAKIGEVLEAHQFVETVQLLRSLTHIVAAHKGLYAKTGDITELEVALSVLKASDVWATKMQNMLNSKKDKLEILNMSKQTAQDAMDLLFQLSQKSKDKKYFKDAFSFSESNKSAVLSDVMKAEKALSFGEVPDSLVKKEKALSIKISNLKKELLDAKDSLKQALENDLVDAVTDKDHLVDSLEKKYPKYYALKYKKEDLNIEEVQSKLLGAESLLLEYFVQDTVIYLLAITSDDVELFVIPTEKNALKEQVGNLRLVLTDYTYILKEKKKAYNLFVERAHRFHHQYVAPALAAFPEKNKLIVVADGLLGYIPFEALLMSLPTGEEEEGNYKLLDYLINKYEVNYSYSTALLMENVAHKHAYLKKPKLVAFAASYPEANKRLEKVPDSRTYYHRELRRAMADLPSTRAEVKSLEELFPNGEFFYGNEATEAQFNAHAMNGDILHLAMHGNLNPKHPLLSNLAFTEDGSKEEDNFVEAHELSTMELDASLVVLSACETGYGKFQDGEGVLSLARSFMYAGVPSLIVSLWQVNDNSTEMIMLSFYSNLNEGMTKSEALQKAKRTYLKSVVPMLAHPAFWAAFIQLGDDGAIIPSRMNLWIFLAAGILLIILFAVGRKFIVQ